MRPSNNEAKGPEAQIEAHIRRGIPREAAGAGLFQEDAMSKPKAHHHDIPGTVIFDGVQARKGYALNKMCYSFNEEANRRAFVADEDAYCAR